MGYAVRNDGRGWRAVDSADDCFEDEAYSEDQPLPPAPTTEDIIASFTSAIQQKLDDFAKTRGYDNSLSACTYASSQVAKFQSEGQYMVYARDSTWETCYQILAEVEAGNREFPTLEQIVAELPELAWPN